MKKSVYSLVLMDDVIDAIDRLAYSQGTSRSNLINQILAEHVQLSTPEKRMKDVFEAMEQLMNETLRLQFQPSDSMISIRSPLHFKYKPTIRYSLELYRNPQKHLGKLKIAFRTQNEALLQALNDFFHLWINLETYALSSVYPEGINYSQEDGRLIRELNLPPDFSSMTESQLGEHIASYVKLLDSMIKLYFRYLDQPESAEKQVTSTYLGYRKQPDFPVL